MKCAMCKQGKTVEGKIATTFEREGTTFVFKGVPAQICSNCGEEYISEDTFDHLYKMAEKLTHSGVEVLVQTFPEAG